jgi:hypothetical protein
MSGFFDDGPPPALPEFPDYKPPPWAGAPENILPVGVALNAVLAQTERLAVMITTARAYPTGISFELSLVRRDRPQPDEEPYPFLLGPRRSAGGVRFGIGFADGRRAVFDAAAPPPDEPPAIALRSSGGGGGGRRWDVRVWVWPLPPEGPLTFAFAWPDEGIEEATAEVDSAPIRAAAARAVELWPDDRPEPPAPGAGGGWSSYAPG